MTQKHLMPSEKPKRGAKWLQPILNDFVGHLERDDKWVLIGCRGYYESMARADRNDFNIYDDALFMCKIDEGKIVYVESFNYNADPSREYRAGLAHLKCLVKGDKPYRYKPGKHGYNRPTPPYDAFRQAGNVTVLRDGKNPGDKQIPDTGNFAINIHRGGDGTTSSLGCQTLPPEQWLHFQISFYQHLKDAKMEDFPYILVERVG
jgi:lysozyme